MTDVFSQYFVLADVLDILKLQISEEEALQLMMESDIYFFLLFPNGPQEALGVDAASEDSLERRSDEPAGTDGVRLAFRHIGILNAIYDSLSFAERRSMNKHVAGVLEGLLSDENQDTLLPSIEFHYSRTGDVDKIIHYRDVLG
ncbi:hypothetical protein HK101_000853 [Irineochytrium annulatum]|nr:hypothetical protein HK101_000853 [Irineochytrium annulatum]